MSNKDILILDYGLGNIFSIVRAFKFIGANIKISENHREILCADRIILPGVGAFGDGIKGLRERNLIEPLYEFILSEKPIIGICLGMQLLMEESEEFGLHKGLGIIKGKVKRLSGKNNYKIPHVGWNNVFRKDSVSWDNMILEGIAPGEFFYFVHSFAVLPENNNDILGFTEYGDNNFCSVIHKNNVMGCQFHPERSGEIGLQIYRNFIEKI